MSDQCQSLEFLAAALRIDHPPQKGHQGLAESEAMGLEGLKSPGISTKETYAFLKLSGIRCQNNHLVSCILLFASLLTVSSFSLPPFYVSPAPSIVNG